MRAIVQRVSSASVSVDGRIVGEIGAGLLVLVAAGREDTETSAKKMAERVFNMRIFNDETGKMNLALSEVSASVLAVSNFTVYGDTSQRRPSFVAAAPYERGEELFGLFVSALRGMGVVVETGEFGADMKVSLVNDGPVTVVAEV